MDYTPIFYEAAQGKGTASNTPISAEPGQPGYPEFCTILSDLNEISFAFRTDDMNYKDTYWEIGLDAKVKMDYPVYRTAEATSNDKVFLEIYGSIVEVTNSKPKFAEELKNFLLYPNDIVEYQLPALQDE